MRTEVLIESQTREIRLTERQAQLLQGVGRSLASSQAWWGEESPPDDRSIIRCQRVGVGRWKVRVLDAIGLIAINDLQLSVRPKIPTSHLIFLLQQSEQFPRLDPSVTHAEPDMSFWDLVATWFIVTAEKLLRNDLSRNYAARREELNTVRGSVDPLATTSAFLSGRPILVCEYEEFTRDTPLNRVILAAARVVAASRNLKPDVRQRARAVVARMWDVGVLRHGDTNTRVNRRTARYADSLVLARHVLSSTGRGLGAGSEYAQAFLIRTPEMVEDGIRALLQDALSDQMSISKKKIKLDGSGMELNPDLVVGDSSAVADVKYKVGGSDWGRSDLYQIVAFATGLRTRHGAIIDFRSADVDPLEPIQVGEVCLSNPSWPALADISPLDAADTLVASFSSWMRDATRSAV